ncbi:MAG: Fe-S cluster assembly protein SufD [Legionellales bacterium]|nr:Fe-S cluster assembly protein SufD [Legionellales bacterium]
MSEEVDFYQQQAKVLNSSVPWVKQLQDEGSQDLCRLGFPTRHHEHWKYTSLNTFLQKRFHCLEVSQARTCTTSSNNLQEIPSSALRAPSPHVWGEGNKEGCSEDADKTPKGQGLAIPFPRISESDFPIGALVMPLPRAMVEHAEKIKPYLNKILHHEHGFHALNTAMLHDGMFIYLPKGVCLGKPLCLSHWQDRTDHATYLRHLVVLEEVSSLSLVEDYQGSSEACYFTNTITEVHLSENTKLSHYKIQREGSLAYHVGELVVQQASGSQLQSHLFSIGGALVRSDTSIDLAAPNAECLMNGIYLPVDHQHMDHHTLVTHSAPHCRSLQDYKGVLRGKSRAVFNGRVIVAPGANHTEAIQQNKNLLLSSETEIDTKPQLEIFANDVVCTHGATVGQLDEEALFYLATRGIERAQAMQYLVQAFTVENMRKIANDEIAAMVGPLINPMG